MDEWTTGEPFGAYDARVFSTSVGGVASGAALRSVAPAGDLVFALYQTTPAPTWRVWWLAASNLGSGASVDLDEWGVPLLTPGGGILGVLGDLDGDGAAEIGVGAPEASGKGEVVWYMGGALSSAVPGVGVPVKGRLRGSSAGGRFGAALGGCLGGVGGRHFVVVSQPDVAGQEVLIFDPAELSSQSNPKPNTALSEPSLPGLGESLLVWPDINGDHHSELVAGAPGLGGGAVAVWWGRDLAAWTGAEPDVVLLGVEAGCEVGATLAAPGDLDLDGVGDLIVGGPGCRSGAGSIFFLSGASLGEEPLGAALPFAPIGAVAVGSSLSAGVDLSGDGVGDVVVGGLDGHLWVLDGAVIGGASGDLLLGSIDGGADAGGGWPAAEGHGWGGAAGLATLPVGSGSSGRSPWEVGLFFAP